MTTRAERVSSVARRALELAGDGQDREGVAHRELALLLADGVDERAVRVRVRQASGTTKEQRQEALRLLYLATRKRPDPAER